jgi:L-aminopeptidase/D-esterase-like protein
VPGGLGTAAVRVGDATVGALVACNPAGDVIGPDGGVDRSA